MQKARSQEQKTTVVFVLDTSGSMYGAPIEELNKALIQIKEDILNDTMLSNRLEIGIVAFDDDARVERPIDLISPDTDLPILNIGGVTNLVAGMNKAIELVTDRKNFYKSNGEQYCRPFIVLFTDGAPTNTSEEIEQLDQTIQKLSDEKRFIFLPFGVDGADMQLLAKIAAQTADERLKNTGTAFLMKDVTKFTEVFQFVCGIITGNDKVQLPTFVVTPITFDLST